MTTFVLDRSNNGSLTRSFSGIVIADTETIIEEREAIDGTLLPLVRGYRNVFSIRFRYLSDSDVSFLRLFLQSDNQRIQYNSIWYVVRSKEKKLLKKDRSEVEINLIETTIN